MPKLVIIGGGGFMGQSIAAKFSQDHTEYQIVILDLKMEKLPIVQLPDTVIFHKGSFLDSTLLNEVLQNADVVFHLAAVGMMGLSANDKDNILAVNVEGTRQLLEKCQFHNVKRFVYASSIAVVFTGKPLWNVTEDAKLPKEEDYLNHYSVSKAMAEQLVLESSTPSFKTTALRFRGVYGPGDPNVTKKVADLIRANCFLFLVSSHNIEAVSQATSIENCTNAFVLSEKMLQRENGPHGKPYFILDDEVMGNFTFWKPLILKLGHATPQAFISYSLVRKILPIYEKCCYLIKCAPILSLFELETLCVHNTYSTAAARADMGYQAEPSLMEETAAYCAKHTPETTTLNPLFCTIFIIFSLFMIIFYYRNYVPI